MVAIAALSAVARLVNVPYPIILVVGGLAIGLLPGGPDIQLQPDLVLVIFLPPLLYAAAFFSSLHDLRAQIKPISALAVGLVIATTRVVAVVAHFAIDDCSWGAAFTPGAIVEARGISERTADRLRQALEARLLRYQPDGDNSFASPINHQRSDFVKTMDDLVTTQRNAVVALRNEGEISNEVILRLEREFDLETSRLPT